MSGITVQWNLIYGPRAAATHVLFGDCDNISTSSVRRHHYGQNCDPVKLHQDIRLQSGVLQTLTLHLPIGGKVFTGSSRFRRHN